MGTFFIKHITKYTYSNPVIDGAHLIRLHPINDAYQKINSHYLVITNNAYVQTYTDFYNNLVGTFMLTEPVKELHIESNIEVSTTERIFPEDTIDADTQWKEIQTLKNNESLFDFLINKPFSGSNDFLKFIEANHIKQKTPFKAVLELCEFIYNNITYKKGVTKVDTSLDEVWQLKAGVCQDFTNIMLQIVRMCGIPARYVSGYICPNTLITRGEGATHAWIEAYIPFYGWLGIDPTNNAIANQNHVRLAVGRSYEDCAPVKGVFRGRVDSKLDVTVEVSTTKNDTITSIIEETAITKNIFNSYQRNLERIQQQQQQQQ